MFVGHYGPSFALNRSERTVPLWLLFLAVQFVDILWAVLVLAGVEKVRITPGFTETSPLDLYYMPYTHSLTASIAWAVIIGLAFAPKLGRRAGIIMGIAVLSHWIVDLPVHVADLPLYGNAHKVGFGLWNHRWAAFALEAAVLLGGIAYWGKGLVAKAKRRAWIFGVIMLGIQLSTIVAPMEQTTQSFAVSALVSYFLLAAGAHFVDRARR